MKLDVGCGSMPEGDVNVDLFRVNKPSQCVFPYNGKDIPCFIQGDAHKLPVRDKCFEESLANNVLEHCVYPVMVLRELERVTKRKITVIVPLCDFQTETHLINWDRKNFLMLLETTFPNEGRIPSTVPNKHSGKDNFKVEIFL